MWSSYLCETPEARQCPRFHAEVVPAVASTTTDVPGDLPASSLHLIYCDVSNFSCRFDFDHLSNFDIKFDLWDRVLATIAVGPMLVNLLAVDEKTRFPPEFPNFQSNSQNFQNFSEISEIFKKILKISKISKKTFKISKNSQK
jgi:hypothetical protein